MTLPTAEEINVHDSLDEICACDHFLGKTLDQAEEMFRDDGLNYQEDLMWMGPRAFNFYLRAVINYLRSEHAVGDDQMIACMLTTVEFRSPEEEFPSSLPNVLELIDCVAHEYDKFEVDENIYGNLRQKYEQLRSRLPGST